MLVKMIPIIFQIGIKLKQISPFTNLLVEVTTSQYTNTQLSRLHLYSRLILLVLKLRKMCKSENMRRHTRKETKTSHLIWMSLAHSSGFLPHCTVLLLSNRHLQRKHSMQSSVTQSTSTPPCPLAQCRSSKQQNKK